MLDAANQFPLQKRREEERKSGLESARGRVLLNLHHIDANIGVGIDR